MRGIININKPEEFTSHDVVAILRRLLGEKRIGHTGTLDPMATGVLVVCVGNATRIIEYLDHHEKEYRCRLRFGLETDTYDVWGRTVRTSSRIPSGPEIETALAAFRGEIEQVPPMYAAIKVKGKKLYEYARQGQEIELEPRPVEIFKLDMQKIEMPDVHFHVKCSKGTYIRSLCRDIGDELGCYGTLAALRRTETCGFRMEDGLKISDLQRLKEEGRLESAVLPIDSLLSDSPKAEIRNGAEKLLVNGNKLSEDMLISDEPEDALHAAPYIRIYSDKELSALYKYNSETGCYKCFKYLQ